MLCWTLDAEIWAYVVACGFLYSLHRGSVVPSVPWMFVPQAEVCSMGERSFGRSIGGRTSGGMGKFELRTFLVVARCTVPTADINTAKQGMLEISNLKTSKLHVYRQKQT